MINRPPLRAKLLAQDSLLTACFQAVLVIDHGLSVYLVRRAVYLYRALASMEVAPYLSAFCRGQLRSVRGAARLAGP
jgi:hypothetical protein